MWIICLCRYVWANRTALTRSVHDMSKQMYDNKQFTPVAWAPLSDWLFNCKEETSKYRGERLMKFNKSDREFHRVVAECLWKLACGTNLPWGRSATLPDSYARIPIHEKARGVGNRVSFFFCHFFF